MTMGKPYIQGSYEDRKCSEQLTTIGIFRVSKKGKIKKNRGKGLQRTVSV